MKRPAAVKPGDVVRVKGDISLWLVRDTIIDAEGRWRFALLLPRSGSSRMVKSRDVETHWRKGKG